MSDLVIYGNPFSTYTRTARMACDEKGVGYALEPVDFHAPAFRAVHPFGKIPALRHGDVMLYETLAICRYVDEAFDGPSLQPAEVTEMARMYQWVIAALDYFYPVMVEKLVMERLVAPMKGEAADETVVAAALPDLAQRLGVLNDALIDKSYLAGNMASLADLFLYPILFYVNFIPEGRDALEKAPAVTTWLATMGERASAQATMPPVDKL
ncbi:MAG: glutathione S-transferase family protein [Alphaproteobacteria bacterium]|nr:glutathione S-transferase family protein [Alphaproteobacteria bacterium]